MQYDNPLGHLAMLNAIVKPYHSEFMDKLNNCWVVFLRIDGSVNISPIDKIYVMAKIINLGGSQELLFIGIGNKQKEAQLVWKMQ